jgi:uncharacterized protein (DUF1697 family)
MPRYVAFLRAINVGGHVVKMDRLKAVFESAGHARVETFIASGNVVFESRSTATAKLERAIEKALEKALGYEVATFIRTDEEVAAIALLQPFAPEAVKAARAFSVGFLSEPLGREDAHRRFPGARPRGVLAVPDGAERLDVQQRAIREGRQGQSHLSRDEHDPAAGAEVPIAADAFVNRPEPAN